MNESTADGLKGMGDLMNQSMAHDRDATYNRILKQYTEMDVPRCTHCGATDTASVQVGLIGLTIRLAATCRKFKLLANGPNPRDRFCHACKRLLDDPAGDAKPTAEFAHLRLLLRKGSKAPSLTARLSAA